MRIKTVSVVCIRIQQLTAFGRIVSRKGRSHTQEHGEWVMSNSHKLFLIAVSLCSVGMDDARAAVNDDKESARLLEAVVVQGGSTSIPASQAELLRVADLFRTMKAKFSPEASLRFQLSTPRARLELANDDAHVDVELDQHSTFDLAALPSYQDGYFFSSVKESKIRPYVRSNLNENHLRIGDMRLECELTWELIKREAPSKVKLYLAMHGGWCGAKRITWTYAVGKPIRAAEITDGDRVIPVAITQSGMAAIVPIQESQISNSAVLTIKIGQTAPVIGQPSN